jgi:asparagine synthase (glutamine-hydrolysing)
MTQTGDLSFILRSLMHRNDTMGMAHGLETRYPFLSQPCMKLAVNLPHRAKIRLSPTALDWSHLFIQDKWILRQVAGRYLPREISHRKKIPFPTSVNRRLEVAPKFFQASFVSDLFGLNAPRTAYLIRSASHALRLRLLHLELWGRLYFRGASIPELGDQVRRHVCLPGRESPAPTLPVVRHKAA